MKTIQVMITAIYQIDDKDVEDFVTQLDNTESDISWLEEYSGDQISLIITRSYGKETLCR